MVNIPLTTIGVKVSYCVETTSGTRPTSGYIHIPAISSTPDMNPAPNTTDVTTFDNTEYTSKIALLKDMPDNIELVAKFGQAFADAWETLVSAYNVGKLTDKATWFCIDIPNYDKSAYFSGIPSNLGMSALETNASIDHTVFITPTSEPVYASDPTYSTETTYIAKFIVSGATTETLVPGALVTIFGKDYTATTDTNGEASFNLVNGAYDYKVSKSGIDTQYGSVTIDGENEDIDITGFNA